MMNRCSMNWKRKFEPDAKNCSGGASEPSLSAAVLLPLPGLLLSSGVRSGTVGAVDRALDVASGIANGSAVGVAISADSAATAGKFGDPDSGRGLHAELPVAGAGCFG